MSNKEIVNKGLQARKDVRAAESRAEKFRQEAEDQRDARFYERNKYTADRREWLEEKQSLVWQVEDLKTAVRCLAEDRAVLIDREKQTHQRHILADAVQAIVASVLFAIARDLGWIVPWLANVLAGASILCLILAVAKLTRNK